MDIKDLNKVQLILLALLLSFVTSIATGITTVTLMQQAPASVTVPINRIVQQTVEKIVPVEGKTTVETVIIKEEDLVVEAIASNQKSVFIVSKEIRDLNNDDVEVNAGVGTVVSPEGVIVVDAILVPGEGKYFLKNNSGKFRADFLGTDPAGFSFVKIGAALNDTDKVDFTMPTAGDIKTMKKGQKILIAGTTTASLIFDGVDNMKLNIVQANAGAPVINLAGEVLGVALLNDSKSFISLDTILEKVKTLSI